MGEKDRSYDSSEDDLPGLVGPLIQENPDSLIGKVNENNIIP